MKKEIKSVKKLTFSAMAVALGTVFMIIGVMFEALDMTVSALASLLVAVIYVEIGSPYTFLVWIATTLTVGIMYPGSIMWLMYLVLFGVFPILKGYIERLKRPLWLPLKLIYGNLAMLLIILGSTFVLGVPFLDDSFGLSMEWVYIITFILTNAAVILYDLFLTVLIRFYMDRLHPVLHKMLK